MLRFLILLLSLFSLKALSAFSIVYFDKKSNILDNKTADYLAQLTSYTTELRQKRPVLLLNGGNAFFPSELSKSDFGRHMIILSNMMRVDLMTLNNRDLIYGVKGLTRKALSANFPIVTGDLRKADGLDIIDATVPIHFQNFGKTKVAIASSYVGSRLIEPLGNRTSLTAVNPLTETDAQSILELAESDLKLLVTTNINYIPVAYLDMFDAVITPSTFGAKNTFEDKVIFNPKGTEVLVLHVNQETELSFEYIDIQAYPKDRKVERMIARYQGLFESAKKMPLATLEMPMTTRMRRIRSEENIFGNLVTDAMRMATEADVAVINSGAIRGHHEYDKGHQLTRLDVYNELPFDHKINLISVSGETLHAMMENSLSMIGSTNGRFLQISGMTVTYDTSKTAGSKIQSISVNNRPLDKNKVYKLAINDYMLGQGDGYSMFKGAKVEKGFTPRKTSELVINYLVKKPRISKDKSRRLISVKG